MPSTDCPHCQTYSNLQYRWGLYTYDPDAFEGWLDVAYTCDRCGRILSTRLDSDDSELRNQPQEKRFHLPIVENTERYHRAISWQPPSLAVPEYEDVPEAIRSPAQEAHRGYGVGNVRSAILIARSVIEAVAKDHKVSSNDSLYKKIEAMKDAQLLPGYFVEMAHEIRVWGNDMAHGDFGKAVHSDDALSLLDLMDSLLDTLYTQKASVGKLKARRAQRDAQNAGSSSAK